VSLNSVRGGGVSECTRLHVRSRSGGHARGSNSALTVLSLLPSSCVETYSLLAAHKLYPLRVRLVNLSGALHWFTVAYVPVVKTLQEEGSKERGRLRRSAVLQRVLYMAFRSSIAASNFGVSVPDGRGGTVRAFVRLLLYLCDEPEERAVLCLKAGMCKHLCSFCTTTREDMVSVQSMEVEDRNVLRGLERHLEAAAYRRYGRQASRRLALEKRESGHSSIPVLGAMAGLGTAPHLL